MEIFSSIVVVCGSLLGVLIGAFLQFYFSRSKEYETKLLHLETQAYIDFIKAVAELKTAQIENDSERINRCCSFLADAKTRICLY